MKKLILLLALCLPAAATITFTAGTPCASSGLVTHQTCAVGSVTVGQMIWIGVSWAGGTCLSTSSVADGANTYSIAGTASQAGTTSARSAIFYTIATTNASITADVTNGAGCFITVMPAVVTGQAATNFVGETLQSNGTSVQSCTIAFTRSAIQLMTIVANDNVASADVGWSTTGSTGTFTLGGIVSNGLLNQPGASAFQRVTSGTTVNGVLAVTATAGGMACNGFSINESTAIIKHSVTQSQ